MVRNLIDLKPLVLEVTNVEGKPSQAQASVSNEDGNAAESIPSWIISLKGEMLRELHRMIYYGSTCESLQLRVTVKRRQNNHYIYGKKYPVKIITATELRPQRLTEADNPDHSVYQQTNLQMSNTPVDHTGDGFQWTVTIEVLGVNYICLGLEDILPPVTETNRKIYAEKKDCDFAIISEDGTAIPCHKSFLSAKSPILNLMLQGDFQEATENKMEMVDMSTRGVNALLAFIYCSDACDPLSSSSVAWELLKCADKYDMKDLWKLTARILLQKKHDWYEMDVALALFHFISKCQRRKSKKIMNRMIHVLNMKRDQLPESALYDEMFSAEVAKEMFLLSLEAEANKRNYNY